MKIFYFSGTGNTLYAARQIVKDIDGVELQSIKSSLGKTLKLKGAVGIAFPLYVFGLPKMVQKFLQENDFSQVDYFFALQTRAISPGRAFTDLCRYAGRGLDASFAVNMPSAYLPLGDVDSDEKIEKTLRKAEKRLQKIKVKIESRAKNKVREWLLFRLLTLPIYCLWSRFSDLGKKYFVDEKCSGCGICSQVCPSGCITMRDGVPVWDLRKCESCMACINYCPTRSIQLNKKTKGYGRYHHRSIDWKQIVL